MTTYQPIVFIYSIFIFATLLLLLGSVVLFCDILFAVYYFK